MSKCFDIIGDLGEEELYEEYLEEKDLKRFLCTKYSNDCNLDKKTELWSYQQYSLQDYVVTHIRGAFRTPKIEHLR